MSSATVSVDLSKLSEASNTLVRIAAYLGWRITNTHAGGVDMRSPVQPAVHIALPPNSSLNQKKMEGMFSRLMKYSPEERVALLILKADDAETAIRAGEFERWLRRELKANPEGTTVMASESATLVLPAPEPEPEPKPVKAEPVVVSEHPWLARRGTGTDAGQVYPSRTVIERKWSNGHLDYRCAKPGCDYTDPTARSVASHWGSSKDHPVVDPPRQDELMRTQPWEPSYTRTPADRIARLQRELAWALENVGTDGRPGEVAERMAAAIIRERDRKRQDDGDEDRGPLTPEQVVERIRRLVDDGSYYKAIARERELEESAASAQAQIEQYREAAEVAQARADRIEQEWNTLRELIATTPRKDS